MPARDIYHTQTRNALEKDGWQITHDPYRIKLNHCQRNHRLMDTLNLHQAAQTILEQYRTYLGNDPDTSIELAIDPDRDRYLLIEQGWQGERRIYGTILHLDIIDRQIWIQHDGTETGIARDLIQLGIPSDRIVLGNKSPERRKIVQLT